MQSHAPFSGIPGETSDRSGFPNPDDNDDILINPDASLPVPVEGFTSGALLPADNAVRSASESTIPPRRTPHETSTIIQDTNNSPTLGIGQPMTEAAFNGSDRPSVEDQAMTDRSPDCVQLPDWPMEFSLDTREGYSNQLIGLSCETDPYLLRHYRYNANGTYAMFRLDFRQVADESKPLAFGQDVPSGRLTPAQYHPVRFVMTHEDIWKDSIKSVESVLSGNSTERADLELLNKLVPNELGARLLDL